MRKQFILWSMAAIVGCSIALSAKAADNATGVEFPHPDRIRYDNRSLIIDGKPVFILSGAMHYFRCPPQLWKDRLQKLKDAGLNCVETYLAWGIHEPQEPVSPDDYSKLRDMEQIGDFIQTARDLGLYVIIRPGPYICAEVDRGGIPGWVMKHRPPDVPPGHFFRGDTPVMLAWDRHWLTAAAKVVKPHLITNVPKGSTGVILWQLENEYDWSYPRLPSQVRVNVLHALAQASLDSGIDVPLFTCETMDPAFRTDPLLRAHVFNTTNKYPNFSVKPLIDSVEAVARYQPEAFRGVSELQGGWFAAVGGILSEQRGLNAAQISQLTLTAIERGCTYMNYYMFYGGSNFGNTGIGMLTQTYDYNAPLREWGERGDRYYAVKAVGMMLREHGERLIQTTPVDLTIMGDHPDVSIYLRRAPDGSKYFFVRNGQKDQPRAGTVSVRPADGPEQTLAYNLDKFEAKVLYVPSGAGELSAGQWLPKPADRPPVGESSSDSVPVRVTTIRRVDPSDKWVSVPFGKPLYSVDDFDQRYVHYRVNFDLSADELKAPLSLLVHAQRGGNPLVARINGTAVSSTRSSIPLGTLVHQGSNQAEILFENLGCTNARLGIEEEPGITGIELAPQAAPPRTLESWRMKAVARDAVAPPEVAPDFSDKDWSSVSMSRTATTLTGSAVYRTTLAVSNDQRAAGVTLTFEKMADRGTLFVNGKEAGTADYGSIPWTFDITPHLHDGDNTIAVLLHSYEGKGGLSGCTIGPAGRVLRDLHVSLETVTGAAMQADEQRKGLVRYEMEFELPRTPQSLSVPWKLHLEADVNAFFTLNGRPMGRYWAAGPQRDIWLPECWLNFGPGSRNVVELEARPTSDKPVGQLIKLAEVRPYGNGGQAMNP